ncbi:restriction endonuclease subunit S [Microbacterium sp. NPDC090007]|uniref:restriction endonuclease subunit S n=1 Tax=Microbacterium sp. NPDC090007 TaxID=3364204 RepID=UPI0038053D68
MEVGGQAVTVATARFAQLDRWDAAATGMQQVYAFPVVALGDIADIRLGAQVPRKGTSVPGSSHPYLRAANVRRGHVDTSDIRQMTVSASQAQSLALAAGDLLFVEGSGSVSEVGRAAVWDGHVDGCIHQNSVVRARLRSAELSGEYLLTWFNSRAGNAYIREQATTTSGLFHIGAAKLAGAPIPMADPDTQLALVEAVSNQRRAAEHARAEAKAQLAQAWERFSDEIATRAPKGNDVGVKVQRFAALDRWDTIPDNRGLVSEYPIRAFGEVADLRLGTQIPSKHSKAEGNDVEYLRAANVQAGHVSLTDLKLMAATDATVSRLRLEVGDVLVVEGNSREEVGRAAVWDGEGPDTTIIQNSIIRARLKSSDLTPEFVAAWLNCAAGRAFAQSAATTTSGSLWHLGVGKLAHAPIPVPPREVQQQLLDRLRSDLHNAAELARAAAAHLERAETVLEERLLRPPAAVEAISPARTVVLAL